MNWGSLTMGSEGDEEYCSISNNNYDESFDRKLTFSQCYRKMRPSQGGEANPVPVAEGSSFHHSSYRAIGE